MSDHPVDAAIHFAGLKSVAEQSLKLADDFFGLESNCGSGSFEVVAGRRFAGGLIYSVTNLLEVHFRYNIE